MLVLRGLALAVQHLTGVDDLLGSAYGRILLLKLGLVVGALLLGLAATCPRGPVPSGDRRSPDRPACSGSPVSSCPRLRPGEPRAPS